MESPDELLLELQNANHAIKLLQGIISLLPGHVYWKDLDGVYRGCNDLQFLDAGFKSRNEMIGKTDYEMPWKEDADFLRKVDAEVIKTKKSILIEEKSKTASGKDAIWLSRKTPLYDEHGNINGILGISLDITELKHSQQNEKLALQKAAADEATKRALLIFAGMSTHDLRTPLSSINLRAAFLKKYIPALVEGFKLAAEADFDVPYIQDKVLADLQQAPEDILQGVREANDYIDVSLKSLKGASQGEELMSSEQLVDCNAERLLQRIVRTYPYKPGQESLLHYDTHRDFNFKCNVIFFNRLIENLIKNAFEQIELTGKGEIFIECGQADNYNIITIKDTAGGVTQSLVDQIFNGIHSTKLGGTGIGLSSAKQIMHGMNGDVKCRLVDGDCIEFVLSFPKIS